ncbi:MAG: amidohydrolase [Flavitalea sp.]
MRFSFLAIILLVSISSFAQNNTLRVRVSQAADKIESKAIAWRRDFHEHPELGNQEVRTAAIIAKHLESLGLDVKTGVAKTGVVGILKGGKPGPVIALRADMDALPITERTPVPFASKVKTMYNGQEVGVMHACGHDTHMAILMGVAEIFASMRKDIKGTIKFIFQPAEEGLPPGEKGGAELMVKEGVLENPNAEVIFGLHCDALRETGQIGYRPGGAMASVDNFRIVIKGKQSHGAYPWFSVDPIVVAAQVITNLQTIVSRNLDISENPGVVSIGSIHGGNRTNIIPEQVEMLGTFRALSNDDENLIGERIKQIVTKTAEANNAVADVDIPYNAHYPVTYNDPALTAKMTGSLQKTVGVENLILVTPRTVSEDFSFYQQKIPGLFIFLGGMPKGKDIKTVSPHHTPDFFIDEASLVIGIKALADLTLDYIDMK